MDGLAHVALLVGVPVADLAGLRAFQDEGALELGRGPKYVEQEAGGRVVLIGVDGLRGGEETDTPAVEFFDPVEAGGQGTAEAVQVQSRIEPVTECTGKHRENCPQDALRGLRGPGYLGGLPKTL